MRIVGTILAGGQGKRMGGADKALLPLAGQTLIAHVIERLGPQVEHLAISANGDPARFADLGVPVLPDDASKGPLSGILAALRWAAPLGASHVATTPVDCPFLPQDLVPRLCLAAEPAGLALASSFGTLHPTFGLWPVTLAPALTAFLASGVKERVRDFAYSQGCAVADFPDAGAFANANTPDDLARMDALIRAQG